MFRVKICGVTRVEDALAAVEAGADAIGLNFYEKSLRCVTADDARRIMWSFDSTQLDCVGVTVNMEPLALQSLMTQIGLSIIQLHGDESPEIVSQCARAKRPPNFTYGPRIIRARRMEDRGVAAITEDLDACVAAGGTPVAVLVDAATPGRYGGTGETVSWVGLADYKRWLGETPLILAGGLTPDNVAEAIHIVRPAAVDVASGVESSPGKKDPVKVRVFVANALGAFAAFG
jgi:phosphoribosylanthranilate isomerase